MRSEGAARKAARSASLSWWLAAALVGVYAATAVVVLPLSSAPQAGPAGMSTVSTPEGSLAVNRLWQRLGRPFHASTTPPEALPARLEGVWVAVAPQPGAYRAQDVRALLSFAARGNHVVWVTDQMDGVLRAIGLRLTACPAQRVTTVRAVAAGMAGHPSPHPVPSPIPGGTWRHLVLTANVQLQGPAIAAAPWREVAGHAVLGVRIRRGKGLIDVWTIPSAWENRAVGSGDNLRVVWDLTGHGPVWWDEYGHGIATANPWPLVFGNGRAWAVAAWFIAALAYVFYAVHRFGRPRPAPEEMPRQASEFLAALARHLEARQLRSYQTELVQAAVRRRMAAKLGLTARADWAAVATAVAQAGDEALSAAFAVWQGVRADGADRPRRFRAATRRLLSVLEGGDRSRA